MYLLRNVGGFLMKKVIIIIVGFVLVVGIISAVVINGMYGEYKAYMEDLEIHDVDLSMVEDGTYSGTSDAGGVVAVDVEVTVENHVIKSIELIRHDNGRGQDAEVIPDRVIEAQSLMVDAVSGATNSSLVILEAIENALSN